jgi:hypothetical protein
MALAVAAVALLVGSLAASAATPSGIRGTVVRSPTKPVCEEDVPCSAPAAGVVLVFHRGGVRVATATTSKAGTYRVVLRPGTYVVRPVRKLPFGSLQPRTVRVLAGRFAVADFELDTGIR